MKRFFLSLSISFALCSVLYAQEEKETLQHTGSWSAILQQAQKENKLIFVDCYFTGCHPCAQMDKEVFPNANISKEMGENFLGIKVDVFKEKLGDTINMKYGVRGFPTFLILNPSGQLISMFSGYQDIPMLLHKLDEAKQKAAKKEFLSGFAASNTGSYPDFYKKYYDRVERKFDPVVANAWIKGQKDWTAEVVALPILKTDRLDSEIETWLLNNYAKYKALYGEDLVLDRALSILNSRMNKALNKQKNETAFRQFLTDNSKNFPVSDWKIFSYMLGYNYYGAVAKDATALLQFMNEEPVVYKNYFGAMYNNILVKKQLNETTLKLLCNWLDKAVTPEAPFELISTAASIHKQNNDLEGYKRFVNMAIEKAKKYKIPTAHPDPALAGQALPEGKAI